MVNVPDVSQEIIWINKDNVVPCHQTVRSLIKMAHVQNVVRIMQSTLPKEEAVLVYQQIAQILEKIRPVSDVIQATGLIKAAIVLNWQITV